MQPIMAAKRRRRAAWVVCAALGILLGGGRALYGAAKPRNPNVVVLRSERLITLNSKMTLTEMAAALKKGSGYSFTLDPAYQKDKTEYALFLRRVPLSRVVQATGYLVDGVWERKGTAYHLRPLSDAERVSDLTRYEALIDVAYDYLRKADLEDPSLPADKRRSIRAWLDGVETRRVHLPATPNDTMAGWRVTATQTGVSATYTDKDPNTGLNHWKGVWWNGRP